MDNFHYHNTFKKEVNGDERFYNNHAAHTDSGLMTVVITTYAGGKRQGRKKRGKGNSYILRINIKMKIYEKTGMYRA